MSALRRDLQSQGEAISGNDASAPELSVVMPCLNEAETLKACIEKVQRAFREHGIAGEIILADNGSTDGSPGIAARMGARVVVVESKGYGSALRGGIAAARGKYIIMGDADDSYDFAQIPLFLEKLRAGFDLVMGNRFKGGIKCGAMPPLHRYLGIPVLTAIARLLFGSPLNDNHCGLRGFRKSAFLKMGLRATGWEFGSEMILRANLLAMRITEIPITLSPDGRSRPPHLRTWHAGWEHLRLMLLYSPRWLFLYPGSVLVAVGLLTGLWLMPGPRRVADVTFNVHTLLYAAAAVLLGFQAIAFSAFTKVFGVSQGLLPQDPRLDRALRWASLEAGLVVGGLLVLAGLGGSVYALGLWGSRQFGPMDATNTLRIVIPAVVCLTLGFEIVLSSFFLSVLRMARQ